MKMGLKSIVRLIVVLGFGGILTAKVGPRPGKAGKLGVKLVLFVGYFNLFLKINGEKTAKHSLKEEYLYIKTILYIVQNPLQATQSLFQVFILEDWLQCGV